MVIEFMRFAAVAVILVLPVGWIAVRAIPLPSQPRLARVGLAIVVGYPATISLYYALGLVHLEAAYPVVVLAALGVCLYWLIRRVQLVDDFNIRVGLRGLDWGGVLLFALAVWIVSPQFRYLVPDGAGYKYVAYWDSLTHVAVAQEMLRGVPPAQTPLAAGDVFARYHIFYHVFVMLASRYGGIDLLRVFFVYAPLFNIAVVVLGLCLTMNSLFADRAASWLAVGAVFIFGTVVEEFLARLFAIGAPPIMFFYVSPPALGGLAATVGVFACLALFHRLTLEGPESARAGRLVYLAAFLSAALYLFKAPFFALLYPACLIGLAVFWLIHRRAYVLRAIGVALASVAFFNWSWAAPSEGRFVFEFLVFAKTRLIELQRLLEAKRYAYTVIRQMLEPPAPWGWLALLGLTLVVVWRFAQLSPLLPAYWYNRARAFRRAGLWEIVLAAMYPLVLIAALFFDTAQVGLPPTGLMVAVMLILLSFVSLVLNAGLVGRWLHRRLRARWPNYPARLALMILLVAVSPAAFFVVRQRSHSQEIPLTADELRAYSFLAHETPAEAVVAQNKYLSDHDSNPPRYAYPVVSAFSGRRVVVERLEYLYPARVADVNRLYATGDWGEAASILKRYHVDYILEYDEWPLRVDKTPLVLVFDAGSVRVYRVAHD